MTKEQLDALLAEGKITQEEYDAKLKELEGGAGSSGDVLSSEQIQEMIRKAVQSETDKVRTEYTNKLKIKEQELEAIKAKKMTDEERKADELAKAQSELERVNKELKDASNERIITAKLTAETMSLDFAQFVKADDEAGITEKIKSLKMLFDAEVKKAVDAEFAKHGYTPNGSNRSNAEKNPFSKDGWNLTEQGRLFKENPELYKKLKAQAGN